MSAKTPEILCNSKFIVVLPATCRMLLVAAANARALVSTIKK
jgi:hypothetical protein